MKKDSVMSPFFSINEDSELLYLDRHKIIKLPNELEARNYILNCEGVIFSKPDYNVCKDTVLVLEPHADDFVLSALAFTLNKFNTIVFNIFSKTSLDYFTWKEHFLITKSQYEELRLKESKFAIENLLQQKFVSLREKSMRLTEDCEKVVEERIIRKLKKILKDNNDISTIMVPMGVGVHPDHLMVFNSVFNNINDLKDYKIVLYPEYPYSRCKKSFIDRYNELNKKFKLFPIFIDMSKKIDVVTDCISVYRSQFDDINRSQMFSIVNEDYKALAVEYGYEEPIMVYYELGDKKYED